MVFTVTDKHGRYVKDLKKNDFKVLDDTRPADEIRSFHNETDLPLQVGLLVDAVSDILTVTDDLVQPTPDVASEMAKIFVRGVLAVEGRMISMISLDNVLPAPDRKAA